MSTFSGLSTALSSLIAQRQALEVSGQNIANANTVGYTRQRANLASVSALSAPSMFSSGFAAGNGVGVTGISRLGDIFLDARVQTETGSASLAAVKANAYARLESTVAEPGDEGVSNALQEFWADWEDVGNDPGSDSFRTVLLENATALAQRINAGHSAVTTQWSQTLTELKSAVVDVNSSAAMIAGLNESIRGVTVSGGSANELIDQRNLLVTGLSALIGATGVERADGTFDVMVGGNALVRGDTAQTISVTANAAKMGDGAGLFWGSSGAGTGLGAGSGAVVGMVAVLAPAVAGGTLAKAGAAYDLLASTLITKVNDQHKLAMTTVTVGGVVNYKEGQPFFKATEPGASSAATLAVAITNIADIAVADGANGTTTGAGALDGSMALQMQAIGTSAGGPDALWSTFVADLGVSSRAATQRATITDATRSTAVGLQLSNSSVDIDEEAVNMLAYQRAYEGAARVLSAIDEMLDTLINRTAV